MKCYAHPDVETGVSCSNCERPLCPKCMVYTPVGVKCVDCARQRGRAIAGPRPIYYFKAAGFGLGSALIGGMLLTELSRMLHFGSLLLVIILGWAVGEAVSRGARRNTGLGFQLIAAAAAFVAYLVSGYITGVPVVDFNGWQGVILADINIVRLLFAGFGIYLAAVRLRD